MNDLTLIQQITVWTLPVLFAITLHEVAHGWMASKLGDQTARMLGRLTLNPFKHIDPIGTIVVPAALLMFTGFVFGWAKAVPVDSRNFKNPRKDMAWVAIAGPAANFIMALMWAFIAKIGMMLEPANPSVGEFLIYSGTAGITINLILMLLNLLPIPPLDGSRVIAAFMPKKLAWQFGQLDRYGFIILIVLLLTGLLQTVLIEPFETIRLLFLQFAGLI